MSKHASLVEKLVWVYVYAGMILLGLGLAVQRSDATTVSYTHLTLPTIYSV